MKRSHVLNSILVCAALGACAIGLADAQQASPIEAPTPAAYEPYAFLIGEWDTGPAGAPPSFVDRFAWGPSRAYITQSVSLLTPQGEHLHFEGPMMWNAATQRLDFLFAIEPPSLGQESGDVSIAPDGSFVRDVTLTSPNGAQSVFRHTIRRTGADTATASLVRQTSTGWEPTFPGSDYLEMRRRPA